MLGVHPRHADGTPSSYWGYTLVMLVVHPRHAGGTPWVPASPQIRSATQQNPLPDYKFLKELVPSENVPLSYASDTCKTVGLVFSFFGACLCN